jgi:RNA polymerase sigma factor (sigma-70 family)
MDILTTRYSAAETRLITGLSFASRTAEKIRGNMLNRLKTRLTFRKTYPKMINASLVKQNTLTTGGAAMIEKVSRMALLQDFYAGLLTEKQRRMLELYYDDNLSLGEIAEECGISRQGVHDLLKRAEKLLESYEARLGLMEKFLHNQRKIEEALNWLQTLTQDDQGTEVVARISELLYEVLDMEDIPKPELS